MLRPQHVLTACFITVCSLTSGLYAQNVGIGTNAPQNRLHIDGAAPADANSGQLRISESTNGRFMLLGRAAGYGFIQTHNSQPLAINPLGNNVGIGTTAPDARLHVYANNEYATRIAQETFGSIDGAVYTELAHDTWSSSFGILFNAYRATPGVNGNLFVTGNTKYKYSPGTYNRAAAAIGGYLNSANGGHIMFFSAPPGTADNDITWTTIGQLSRDFVWLSPRGTSSDFHISNTAPNQGSVGIGTTNPTERLHVAGNLRLDNAFMPGNDAGTAGSLLRSAGAGNAPVWLAPGANGSVLTISSGLPTWSSSNSLFWGLTGNSGTNPATNFLGTTDAQPLVIRTNNTERVRVTSGGNVGIGTTTPALRLDVAGPARVRGDFVITASSNTEGGQIVLANAGDYTTTGENCNSWNIDVYVPSANNERFRIFWGSASCSPPALLEVVNIRNNGNVGILQINPLVPLHVIKPIGHAAGNGTNTNAPSTAIIAAGATAYQNDWPNGWGGGLSTWDINCAGIYYSTLAIRSDRRWKREILPISDVQIRDRFMQLMPVSYRIDPKAGICDDPERLRFGFIANEIEKLFPNLVINAGADEETPRGVEYDGFIPLLVSMVQAQQRQIERLEQRITELETMVLELSRGLGASSDSSRAQR